jgi:hypothetical protein
MALHVPSNLNQFATYTTKRKNELLLGYEYEIDSIDYGPPQPRNEWHNGSAYCNHTIKVPKNFRGANKDHPIKTLPNFFHLSYESLGRGNGYEIKSVIAPMSIHKQIIKRVLFPNVTFNDDPRNAGGIHVSISRTPRTQACHERVFQFLHVDMPRPLQLKLSERTKHSFDQYARQVAPPPTPYQYDPFAPPRYSWSSHYAIINRENHNRYEFRMFHARKHLLLPAIEMAHSLFELATETKTITMENWTSFIKKKLKYQHIADHVRQKL